MATNMPFSNNPQQQQATRHNELRISLPKNRYTGKPETMQSRHSKTPELRSQNYRNIGACIFFQAIV